MCCSYFSLEAKVNSLKDLVSKQKKQMGLPDDYDPDEDNIYLQELKEEERRANMSYRQRQEEDGIVVQKSEGQNLTTVQKRQG